MSHKACVDVVYYGVEGIPKKIPIDDFVGENVPFIKTYGDDTHALEIARRWPASGFQPNRRLSLYSGFSCKMHHDA